jgi:Restriction endonuclease
MQPRGGNSAAPVKLPRTMIELLNIDCMEPPLVIKGAKGFQKGHKHKSWLGKKHTPETKEKMRIARLKNNPMKNPDVVAKRSNTLKLNGTFANENSNTWKGGKTAKSIIIRNSKEYKEWRILVFNRDDYTCQECGDRCKKGNTVYLEAHHIKPFATHPKLRFDITNGQTLCRPCHLKKPKGREIKNG